MDYNKLINQYNRLVKVYYKNKLKGNVVKMNEVGEKLKTLSEQIHYLENQ